VIALAIALAFFVVHTVFTPAGRSFLDVRLLKNRNFITGLIFIFIVGLVLYATRALTPTMLQSLLGYPALAVGLLTAPSGAGTMFSMLLVGRLVGRVDVRALLLAGFSITAFSLWQMSGYTLVLSAHDIVWPGVIQGIGLGLVFVPLSTATFATLEPAMLSQGTALYSLVRNIGSSIGISLVQTLLVRNTQTVHASMAAQVNAAALAASPAAGGIAPLSPAGLAMLNAEITRQAAMVAYIDDFKLMLALTLLVIPLLWLIAPGRNRVGAAGAARVAME
jgi:DHA2 family multidrug resistance protein